jgi:hypothetical protein
MRTFARRGSAALLSVVVVAGLTPQATAGPVGLDRAQEVSAPQAQAALAAVEAAFTAPADVSARRAIVAGRRTGREATLALRDLWLARESLSPEDRATADGYFARPTEGIDDPQGDGYTVAEATGSPSCGTHVCVHWVDSSPDTIENPAKDDGVDYGIASNLVPDWVDENVATFENAWTTLSGMGYKAPLSDGSSIDNGGSALFDVYLADLADSNLYGYCWTDDPAAETGFVVSGFCVVDNDFAEFANGPLNDLHVTAAHEFFHAVQFAYDIGEDRWFMEGTAAWIEDVLYDDIDDNLQYINTDGNGNRANPLTRPDVSLDKFSANYQQYGAWLWFRYLSEKYATPDIVRRSWELAEGYRWSTNAVKAAIAQRGGSFPTDFTQFALGNRIPGSTYDEGSANSYPAAALTATMGLSPTKLSTRWQQTVVNHLATRHIRLNPSAKFKATNWRLKVNVDLAKPARGVRAYVVMVRPNSSRVVTAVKLNSNGDGALVVPFFVGKVDHIELSLINTSSRFTDCWVNPTPYTCSGKSLDDGLKSYFVAKAFRR